MELIVAILLPFPLGFFLKRSTALLVYIAVQGYVFTFQTATLLVAWTGGSEEAFGPFPAGDSAQIWSYGGVNLAIYVFGLGLLTLGGRLGAARGRRATRPVSLDAPA